MSVVEYRELWSGRSYHEGEKLSRDYKRRFLVLTDNRYDDGAIVRDALPVRILGPYITPLTIDLGALCKSVNPKQREQHPRVWDVDIDYSSIVKDPGRQDPIPTARPVDIEWGQITYQKAFELAYSMSYSDAPNQEVVGKSSGDKADLPIQNAAGDVPIPALQEDDHILTLTVGKNVVAYNSSNSFHYQNTCNSQPFFGGAPETWKCIAITGTRQFENQTVFWRQNCIFHYRADNWRKKMANKGFNELVNGKKRQIVDWASGVMRGERFLDSTGKAIPPAQPGFVGPQPNQNPNPIYLNYRLFALTDFNDLRLF